jgi:HEAT repeat protein
MRRTTLLTFLLLPVADAAMVAQAPPPDAPRAPAPAALVFRAPGFAAPPPAGFGPHPLEWTLPAPAFARQEPADSLYRLARDLLNRGEYRRAADTFARFEQANPESRHLAASMYWRAFALYRAGTDADLRQALRTLDEQRQRFATAAADPDVTALVTRVTGALAARGDADAGRRLRERTGGAPACDREDMDVRSEALSALVQTDPAAGGDLLRRTLARQDECTVPLRRRAVYLLGREPSAASAALLLEAARSDPSEAVRRDAVTRLAQQTDAATRGALEQLFDRTGDEGTRLAIVRSLRPAGNPEAAAFLRRTIEREDLPEELRAEAVRSLGRGGWGIVAAPMLRGQAFATVAREAATRAEGLTDADAAFLRALYGRTGSATLRRAALETLARHGGAATDQWLMGIVRDPARDQRDRAIALGSLRRGEVPVAELGRLYDALTERELRSALVGILGSRDDDAATDKLIEIARTGTDPAIRRAAIGALSRKKDPRTTRLLLELVEK